ncbi:12466_t:CDS:2, partial [Acaulospora colombiana]
IEDVRQPMLIGGFDEPPKRREKVTRKPPIPRGLTSSKASSQRPTGNAPSTSRSDPKGAVSNPRARQPTQPLVRQRDQKDSASTSVSRKPALPPRSASTIAHTVPDALVISAQLAPWLFMRASVEGTVEQLELETENLINQEKASLFEIEKHIRLQRQRLEISGQVEILEDLCHPENKTFATQIINLSSLLSTFLSSTKGISHLDTLRDLVHSHEWNPQGRALRKSLEALKRSLDVPASSHKPILKSERWADLFKQCDILLETRLSNLQKLVRLVPVVQEHQNRRMDLSVMNMALSTQRLE